MATEIQKLTAKADKLLHSIIEIDEQIEQTEAKITSLQEESRAATQTYDTTDQAALTKLRVRGLIEAHTDLMSEFKAQRNALTASLLETSVERAAAVKQKEIDAFVIASTEIAALFEKAEPILERIINSAKAANAGGGNNSVVALDIMRHLTGQLIMKSGGKLRIGFHATEANFPSVPNVYGFQEYVDWHCDKPTFGEMELKTAKHFAAQEHNNHWTQAKETDPARYLAGRHKVTKTAKAKKVKAAA